MVPALITASGMLSASYFATWPLLWTVWLLLFLPCLLTRVREIALITVYQVGIPLFTAVIALIVYDKIHYHISISEYSVLLSDDNLQFTAFFQIVATLYAICIAFTLWKAMDDYDKINSILRDEAGKTMAVVSFLKYFDNVNEEVTQQSINEIRKHLRNYAELAHSLCRRDAGRSYLDNSNTERLSKCINMIEDLKSPEENDKIALDGVIKGMSDLIMIRARRISLMESRISPYLIFILGLISFISVLFFFVFDSRQLNAAHVLIPALTYMYTFMLLMLLDLNRSYDGFWKIRTNAFIEVITMLERDIERSL